MVTFSRGTSTGIEDEGIPTEYYLAGNYPNPFNPRTTISFGLPEPGEVSIVLYDMTGRQARILVAERLQVGHHYKAIDLSSLPSGVYIYRMTAGSRAFTKTLHLIK